MEPNKEYKAVPYNGKWIFVEKRQPELGETILNAVGNIGNIHCYNTDLKLYQYIIDGALCSFHEGDVVICYQEIGCGIEGVPCLELSDEENVEEIADKWHSSAILNSHHIADRTSFIEGYKAKGGYSGKDIKKAILMAREKDSDSPTSGYRYIFTKEIISKLQPVVKSICIEMEDKEFIETSYDSVPNPQHNKPRTYTKKIDGKDVELVKCKVNYE